ncbi:hypothetical protein MBT84_20955 [Streptomyces sp. MBT84]|nr:hypothetical protein [Streptomyces sp. MBT84]
MRSRCRRTSEPDGYGRLGRGRVRPARPGTGTAGSAGDGYGRLGRDGFRRGRTRRDRTGKDRERRRGRGAALRTVLEPPQEIPGSPGDESAARHPDATAGERSACGARLPEGTLWHVRDKYGGNHPAVTGTGPEDRPSVRPRRRAPGGTTASAVHGTSPGRPHGKGGRPSARSRRPGSAGRIRSAAGDCAFGRPGRGVVRAPQGEGGRRDEASATDDSTADAPAAHRDVGLIRTSSPSRTSAASRTPPSARPPWRRRPSGARPPCPGRTRTRSAADRSPRPR